MTQGTSTVAAPGTTPGRPAADYRDAAYWARIRAVVDTAPPLSDDQRARLRAAFHQPGDREEQAA